MTEVYDPALYSWGGWQLMGPASALSPITRLPEASTDCCTRVHVELHQNVLHMAVSVLPLDGGVAFQSDNAIALKEYADHYLATEPDAETRMLAERIRGTYVGRLRESMLADSCGARANSRVFGRAQGQPRTVGSSKARRGAARIA